ncbi:MAG: chromate transporter [Oscillospiraceae bacterium]
MIYLQLFLSFFQIGLFSFGGGYATLPLIQSQVVEIHGWLSLSAFTDLVTLSQMTPGPIAINAATFVGTQVAGLGGAAVSTLGCILPACIIVSVLAWVYGRYKEMVAIQGALAALRPAVVALILSAGLSILVLAFFGPGGAAWPPVSVDLIALALFALALFVLRRFKPNPLFVILGCGAVGGAAYLLL